MNNQEIYEDAVHWLAKYGYMVSSDGQGCIVRHQTDSLGVSHVRHLDDLVNLADLMKWAEEQGLLHFKEQRL